MAPIMMRVAEDDALITYTREGEIAHPHCDEPGAGIVSVTVAPDGDGYRITSTEHTQCEACGYRTESGDVTEHDDLAHALRLLPPPPEGELGTDELAEQMFADMALSWSEMADA